MIISTKFLLNIDVYHNSSSSTESIPSDMRVRRTEGGLVRQNVFSMLSTFAIMNIF